MKRRNHTFINYLLIFMLILSTAPVNLYAQDLEASESGPIEALKKEKQIEESLKPFEDDDPWGEEGDDLAPIRSGDADNIDDSPYGIPEIDNPVKPQKPENTRPENNEEDTVPQVNNDDVKPEDTLVYYGPDMRELAEAMAELDKDTEGKWENLVELQKKPGWIQEQAELGLAGTIYSKGWLGPKVDRRIVPDKVNGWLVVDTVTIGPSLIHRTTQLAANILFNYFVPYVTIGAGVIKEKSFVNIRKVEHYEDALTAAHFQFSDIPLNENSLNKMEEGEVVSTLSTGGAYVRAGGGILDLIGVELPLYLNIGPRVKVSVKDTLKISISKESESVALISMEKANDFMTGFGIAFGVFFDDFIDIPVSIGINGQNGWSPLVFNIKKNKRKIRNLIWRLDMKHKAGKKAYEAFMKKDFTVLEDLSKSHPDIVSLEMIKEGKINRTEINAAIDLIIWRTGFRNIFIEGHFQTTLKGGKKFEYKEISAEYIKDWKWFSNKENVSQKYSVMVPLKSTDPKANIGSFVLDSAFVYQDTKTYGEELIDISKHLQASGSQLKLPIKVNPDKNYERVQVGLKVRFTSDGIKRMLNASDKRIWRAVGTAVGILDPFAWSTERDRERFLRQGNSSRASSQLAQGKRIYRYIKNIQNQEGPLEKAEMTLDYLEGGSGALVHKTMVNLIGQDRLMIQGFVRGRHF